MPRWECGGRWNIAPGFCKGGKRAFQPFLSPVTGVSQCWGQCATRPKSVAQTSQAVEHRKGTLISHGSVAWSQTTESNHFLNVLAESL